MYNSCANFKLCQSLKMVFVCAVRTCVNSKIKSKTKDCKLHKFPNDITLVHEWLKNCDILDLCYKSLEYFLANVCVCKSTKTNSNDPVHSTNLDETVCEDFLEKPTNSSISFKSNQSVIANTIIVSSDTSSTSELSMVSSSASTQTTQVLSVNTPRKRSLKAKVNELEKKCNQLEEQFNLQLNKPLLL